MKPSTAVKCILIRATVALTAQTAHAARAAQAAQVAQAAETKADDISAQNLHLNLGQEKTIQILQTWAASDGRNVDKNFKHYRWISAALQHCRWMQRSTIVMRYLGSETLGQKWIQAMFRHFLN